jgi:autotransporter-associated beta strand protein
MRLQPHLFGRQLFVSAACAALLTSLGLARSAGATTYRTWQGTGSGTNWNTPGNWTPNGGLGSGVVGVFDNLGDNSPNQLPSVSADAFEFRSTANRAYDLRASSFTFSAAGTIIKNESTNYVQTINAIRDSGSHNISLQNGTSTILNNGGQLKVISTQTNGRMSGIANANVTLIVDGSGSTLLGGDTGSPTAFLQDSPTSGTLTLSKTGTGSLTLDANSSYSGGTTITAGKLLANNASGSATGTGSVTVNGGTLGGTGFFTGSVIVNDNGVLSPGASIESLNTGANDWNDDTTFVMEFSTDGSTGSAGSQWDLLSITGGLDLSGVTSTTLNLVTMANASTAGLLASWNPNLNHIWTGFVSTTTGVTGFDANDFAFNTSAFQNTLNGTFSVVQNGNNLDLVYTVVPEPGTFAMLLFGSLMMWVLGRKRGR